MTVSRSDIAPLVQVVTLFESECPGIGQQGSSIDTECYRYPLYTLISLVKCTDLGAFNASNLILLSVNTDLRISGQRRWLKPEDFSLKLKYFSRMLFNMPEVSNAPFGRIHPILTRVICKIVAEPYHSFIYSSLRIQFFAMLFSCFAILFSFDLPHGRHLLPSHIESNTSSAVFLWPSIWSHLS